jgi:hypothetical protein
VLAALWNPNVPHFERYLDNQPPLSDTLRTRCEEEALLLCDALGYDMNTVEFAIRDGVPYAIDFMNPAPDMDINSLGKKHFDWMVTHMADMAIRLAKSPKEVTASRYSWYKMAQDAKK